MSRTLRNTKKGKKVCDKDVEWNCKCSYCDGTVKTKKLKKQAWKDEDQYAIDSSSDAMDFFYPEKQAYLDKHYPLEIFGEDELT